MPRCVIVTVTCQTCTNAHFFSMGLKRSCACSFVHLKMHKCTNAQFLGFDGTPSDLILIFSHISTNTNRAIVAYRSFQFLEFEVCQKSYHRDKLACDSQAFIATLLFDSSMSALPIMICTNDVCQWLEQLLVLWHGGPRTYCYTG